VVWSEKAMRELDEILAWIADDKLSNAILVANRIAKSSSG
jgi:plasmid stabilization system protein ParE